MVNSISNDKISPSDPQQSRGATRTQSTGSTAHPADGNAGGPTASDDTLSLSQTGQLFSDAANESREGAGRVQTLEQANALVARIREQLEQSGAQAFAIQTGNADAALGALLEASPA